MKRKPLLPFQPGKKNRLWFTLINIYLAFGVISLVATLFYLLVNLYRADQIISYCIPGLVLGISAAIIYFTGYHSMIDTPSRKQGPVRFFKS